MKKDADLEDVLNDKLAKEERIKIIEERLEVLNNRKFSNYLNW